MAKRIGEALVEKGLIDEQQLSRALHAQLIFGGHLGTNLIEIGAIDEVTLVEALGEHLRVRSVALDRLQTIPPSAIRAVPPELAEKHQFVPIDLEGSTLHIAVIDPKNVGPLSSRTGYKIVPHVAPEIRVFEALEKYYGIPRRPRYITVCNELDRRISHHKRSATGSGSSDSQPETLRGGPAVDTQPAEELDAAADAHLDWEYQYGKSWREIAGEDDVDQPPIDSEPVTSAPHSLREAALRLSRAENARHLADTVLDFAQRHTAGSILFAVKSNTARVWESRGLGLDPEKVGGLKFPLLSGSIFRLLLGERYYRGPVPDDPGTRFFYGSLRIDRPREVLLIPVYLNDHLATVFYGDGGPDHPISADTGEYLDLTERLAMALSMLILKTKIRTV